MKTLMRLLLIWLTVLTVALVWLYASSLAPVAHDVRATDVTADEIDGRCYRLRWIDGTDRYPGGPVTTSGVTCPWGVGDNRP